MKIFTVDQAQQGGLEWSSLRAGLVTASNASEIITPTWKVKTGDKVEDFINEKLAERILGAPLPSAFKGTYAMETGSIIEEEIFNSLACVTDWDMRRVGFIADDSMRYGCSPDALIGDDSGAEIKSPNLDTHIGYLRGGIVPAKYLPQIHFSMFVTGFKEWKFISYNRMLPKLILTVKRDEKIQAAIGEAMASFLAQMDAAWVNLIRLNNGKEFPKNSFREDVINPKPEPKPDSGHDVIP